jgi:hypothetical protein
MLLHEERSHSLPDAFRDLERFASEWALATEYERREKRVGSSMEDLRDYYELVQPKMKEMVAHLNEFAMGALPSPQQALFYLALMFMEVAMAIEFYGQPELRGGFPRHRWLITRL